MSPRDKKQGSDLTRRKFVAGLTAAGATIPLVTLAKIADCQTRGKTEERKLCVFSKHLQFLDYDAMAETAAEIGFDGVDLTVRPGGHVVPEKAVTDLPRAVKAVRNAGLDVYMMTTAITDVHDSYTEPILKTAARLGIGYYRMGYLSYSDAEGIAGSLEAFKPKLKDLAELNEQYTIHGAYQNHAGTGVGAPVWDLWVLLQYLDPRWIGCQYDIRHATVEGGNSWELGLKLISSYIKTTVIKDFKWVKVNGRWQIRNVPIGEGMVNFTDYFEIIRKNRISGPVSVHYEYPIIAKSEQGLSIEEQRKRTISVMRNDLQTLKSMLKDAGLS